MKKILASLIIVFTIVTALNLVPIKAFGGGFNVGNVQNETPRDANKLKSPVQKVVGSVFLILQICAIAGIIVMGVKYMYSSAEQKATLKKGTLSVIIGLVLVFAASTVAQFFITVFNQAI